MVPDDHEQTKSEMEETLRRVTTTVLIAGVLGAALLGSKGRARTEGEVTVGGSEVQGITLLQATVEPQAARECMEEVRSVLQDSAPASSEAISPTAPLVDGDLAVGVETSSIEQAHQRTERGREQLRNLRLSV